MERYDERNPLLTIQLIQYLDEFSSRPGIEACERFIQDEKVGFHHQRPCQGDLLLFAPREVVDNPALQRFNIQSLDHPLGEGFRLGPRQAIIQRREEDVIIDGRTENLLIHILHDDSDPLTDSRIVLPGIQPKNPDTSILWHQDSQKMLEEGCLPTPIGAENRHLLSPIHNEVQTADLHFGHVRVDVSDAIDFDDLLSILHGPILLCNESYS